MIFTSEQHREVGEGARPTEVVGGPFDIEHDAGSGVRRSHTVQTCDGHGVGHILAVVEREEGGGAP